MNIKNGINLKYPKFRSGMSSDTVGTPTVSCSRRTKTTSRSEQLIALKNSVRVPLSNLSRTTNRRQLRTLKQMTLPLNIIPYNLSCRPGNTEMGRRFILRQHLVAKSGFTGPQIFHLCERKALFKLRDKYCFSLPEGVCCCGDGEGWRGSVVLNAKHPSQHNSTVTSFPGFSQLCIPFPYKHVYRFKRLCDFQ